MVELGLVSNAKKWYILFMMFLLLTVIFSGCIKSNVEYTPYIPYNETEGRYNYFFEPGYNETQKHRHELATVDFSLLDNIKVTDLLELRCYPCKLLEGGSLPGNPDWGLEKKVNQSSGSWKFVEIDVTVNNYMNNTELEFRPSYLVDTEGLQYTRILNYDFCGGDFCLFGVYNPERIIEPKEPEHSWATSEEFCLIYKIPINAIPNELNYYLWTTSSQPFGQGTLDLRKETNN